MIHLSQAAIAEIQRRQAKAADQHTVFRLGVQPGGCLEFYYTLGLGAVSPDDCAIDCDGVQLAVDAQSWKYVDGMTLDYSEDLMGGGFRFHNPLATQSCGCGNSFSIEVDPSIA